MDTDTLVGEMSVDEVSVDEDHPQLIFFNLSLKLISSLIVRWLSVEFQGYRYRADKSTKFGMKIR